MGYNGRQVLLLRVAAIRDAPKDDEDHHHRRHDRERDPNAVDGPLRRLAPLLHDDREHVGDDRAVREAVHDRERVQHARARCKTRAREKRREKRVRKKEEEERRRKKGKGCQSIHHLRDFL